VNLYHLGVPSLWRDEAYTIEAARRSPGQIFALLQHSDAVHGAYYLCMHVVISLLGQSATAVRLPSVLATAVAAGFLAVLGRRLAARAAAPLPGTETAGMPAGRGSQQPARTGVPLLPETESAGMLAGRGSQQPARTGVLLLPEAAGMLAGLLYAIAPAVTYYAQEARSYPIVTALAVIATYLLDRALAAGGSPRTWPWWAGYAVAVALTGLFNVLGLLILVAHAVVVLVASGRLRTMLAWAGSGVVAVAVLTPVLLVAYSERGSVSWEGRPGFLAISSMANNFAGSKQVVVPVAVLVAVSVCAGLATGRRRVTAALVGTPWLVLPPVILLTVSQLHPLYNRYVVFCMPAAALLTSDGLAWIARLAGWVIRPRDTQAQQSGAASGRSTGIWAAGALLPSAVIAALLASALSGPQHAIRKPGSRPDNLRKAAAIVRAHEQPGDVVFYLPINSRVLGSAYPGPFSKLRDIALARTPVESATLNGTEVSAETLASRFAGTTRVWLVTNDRGSIPPVSRPVDKEKLALLGGFQEIGHWRTGSSSMLTLFARGRTS
jgi:mannosyltransferase